MYEVNLLKKLFGDLWMISKEHFLHVKDTKPVLSNDEIVKCLMHFTLTYKSVSDVL